MNILKNYMSWCENLMSPQPMREADLTLKKMRRLRYSGLFLCLWVYSTIIFALVNYNYDLMLENIRAVLLPNPLPVLSVVLITSLISLSCIFYISGHRAMMRLSDASGNLDEWEYRQALNINRYGYWISILNMSLIILTLCFIGLSKGLFHISVFNMGFVVLMSGILQIFGSFTVWAWLQKPLEGMA